MNEDPPKKLEFKPLNIGGPQQKPAQQQTAPLRPTPRRETPEVPVESDEIAPSSTPVPGVLLGANKPTHQYAVIGRAGPLKVGLDLNGCNTISLFGVQGFGKSYTLGTIIESAVENIPNVNTLRAPLATVIFHYHQSDVYEPEFITSVSPNAEKGEVKRLRDDYGASPQAVSDLIMLCPEGTVEKRRREYPNITVEPIKFSSSELKDSGWKLILGAYGNDSLYLRQLSTMMRRHRNDLTLEVLRQEVKKSGLSDNIQTLIEDRLRIAEPYIDEGRRLGDLMKPGRTIVVDLRDAWTDKIQALEIFVVLMMIFSAAGREDRSELAGKEFNRLIVFDEAHKYIQQGEIVDHLVQTIREMRHHATSVLIASQDPLSIPRVVIELSTVIVMHRMTSPLWTKHLRESIYALGEGLKDHELAKLEPGEALVWAQKSTNRLYTEAPQKILIRPRTSAHGGGTKLAFRE